jgi:stress-induced morphogen
MARAGKNAKGDRQIEQIRQVLSDYARAHAKARIDIQRQNNVSIRIRIIDPDFKGMDRVDRDTLLWKVLDQLPEDVISNITLLLLLTPPEASKSLANLEFEDPIPSRI